MNSSVSSSIKRRTYCEETAASEAFTQLHPVVARVLVARGLNHPVEANPRLGTLASPESLGGMETACSLLQQAITDDRPITILGDFDADGATGAAVAVRGLRLLGATDVRFCVPDRMRHGYGISKDLITELSPSADDLLISVDTGIACVAGVALARTLGADVIITDHHLPGKTLPNANAIVNPNMANDGFPSKVLSGCGVMFYVLMALRSRMRAQGVFALGKEPDLRVLLDLVAIGTVADMVPLDQNNRALVHAGLARIRRGHCQQGIKAICQVAGKALHQLQTSDIGFVIAPRINAAGRLENMRAGIDCLLSDDPYEAEQLAAELDDINQARKKIQKKMVAEAETMALPGDLPAATGIVVHQADWHPGVVGLVASRVKDRTHRPVVALSAVDEEGLMRGSARSIKGFHIRDALAELHAQHPEVMVKFGGHAMAAGLSMHQSQMATFQKAFDAIANKHLTEEQLNRVFETDGALMPHEFTRQLALQLNQAAPWGQGFLEPCFDGAFIIKEMRTVGQQGGHLKLIVTPQNAPEKKPLDAIAFGFGALYDELMADDVVTLVYRLDINRFRGRENLQLMCDAVMP